MKKQSSSRSQRGSRGIKGKHVVQICVLLGVCIWLIYQVKYSHDKKKEFFEADGKKSTVLLESEEGMVKLGRKDLLPGYHSPEEKEKRVEEDEDDEEEETEKESKSNVENNSTHEEDEKEDEDEEDKSKLGEEEDEEENKHEEEEDDIDEQDQSKTTEDADKDDELLEEEKENGSNEHGEKDKETNHADEIDMTVHEAREEHYKADDASSAVSHESRILNTERLKESFGNSTGPAQENGSNATIIEVEVQKEPVLKLGEAVEKTTTEVKEGDSESSNSESAVPEASGFVQNETRTMQERSQEHDRTADGAPPSGSSDLQTLVQLEQTRNETDANNTVSANITNTSSIQDESRNSTSVSSLIENTSGSNTTEEKESSRYEGDDETEDKESSEHFATEQTEEADDTPESTMLQEEREALTDPQTLPDISIEGREEEDEEEAMAAE